MQKCVITNIKAKSIFQILHLPAMLLDDTLEKENDTREENVSVSFEKNLFFQIQSSCNSIKCRERGEKIEDKCSRFFFSQHLTSVQQGEEEVQQKSSSELINRNRDENTN